MRTIKYIVIHCTGASQNQSIESIKAFWRDVLGWKNPGYHRIIKPNGEVVELATADRVVNGVRGYNAFSYHICWIGGQDGKDNRTVEQKCGLEHEVREARKRFPDAEILGHRDLSPDLNGDGIISPNEWTKECPSFDVKKWLNEINLN